MQRISIVQLFACCWLVCVCVLIVLAVLWRFKVSRFRFNDKIIHRHNGEMQSDKIRKKLHENEMSRKQFVLLINLNL